MENNIKKTLEQTIGGMYHQTLDAVLQSKDKGMQSALKELSELSSDSEEMLHVLKLCVEDYVHALVAEVSEICNVSFETGMKSIVSQKIVMQKELKQSAIITFSSEDANEKNVFAKFCVRKTLNLSDILYLFVSAMSFQKSYDILLIDENTDEEFDLDELTDMHLLDLNAQKGDSFRILLLQEDDSDIVHEFYMTIDDIIPAQKDDIGFNLIALGSPGSWVSEEEKQDYNLEFFNPNHLTALFLFEKLYHDRPDLYDELDDDMDNLMELSEEMIQDEMGISEDTVSDLIN